MKGRKPTRLYTEKINIGSEIKNRLKTSKRSVVWLAEQLECSRTNVYKIFEKQTISTEELFRISEILGCDFFKIYSDRLNSKNYGQ
jgi:hypothetical protein